MWSSSELIVAPATVTGAGGRGVVRLSGDGLEPLLEKLFQPTAGGFATAGAPPRLVGATLSPAGIGSEWGAVPVEILHWPGPQGPTGGPLAEVQLPAAGPLVDAVVAEACRHGARLARGGEFSLRSFLAGRLDLVQAEAVLAVVDATTPAELSTALDALAGGVGRSLQTVRDTLLDLAADIEAAIDFADETTPDAVPTADAASRAAVDRRLADAVAAIDRVSERLAGRDATSAGDLPRVVLAGPPNIGKSSLFNRLVGREAALVADEAGTTRDWVAGRLDTGPLSPPCLLVDIAGVTRNAALDGGTAAHAADLRAQTEIARAAVVVVCRDASGADRADESCIVVPPGAVRIDVLTRCDLDAMTQGDGVAICTSARSGFGIGELRAALVRAVAELPGGRTPATVRMREGLVIASAALAAARNAAGEPGGGHAPDEAVVAALVRRAVSALGEITGAEIGTDLIDRIFSRHCIGK